MPNNFQSGGDLLQDFGRVLAKPGQSAPIAAAAHQLGFVHHDLAREMIEQRSTDGFGARLGLSISCVWIRASSLMLGLVLLKILEAQLQLRDLGIQTLGGLTVFAGVAERPVAPGDKRFRPMRCQAGRARRPVRTAMQQFLPRACGMPVSHDDFTRGRVLRTA